MPHYAHDDNNNRIETLSKEEIYALLAAAIQQGQLPVLEQDTAFVTMLKSIVDGKAYKVAFCTQAQYNELEATGQLQADTYYYITDDESYDDIIDAIAAMQANITDLDTRVTTLEAKKVTGTIEYLPTTKVLFNLIASHPTIRFYTYVETESSIQQTFTFKQVFVTTYQSITLSTGTYSWSTNAYYADGTAVDPYTTLHYEYFN